MKTVYFFINGIATWPGDHKNWNKRAAVWLALNHPEHHGILDEYFTTALTVWINARDRAEDFADLLRQFKGWRIVIVAHSNGCHVAVEALKIAHEVQVQVLHLVAGAVDANFARNGLNWMLKKAQVGKVCVYRGGRDHAMRICSLLAGKVLFNIGLDDKPLGLSGAFNVDQFVSDRVAEYVEPKYGHSTWWKPENFDRTMKLFKIHP